MNFSDLIKPSAVKVVSGAFSKKRLMQDIADLAQSAYGLDASSTLEALQERESLGPTGVGNGIALPHARVQGLDHVQGAFILMERPVEFDAIDRQPVDIVFALFAPEDAGVEHLKALALVSRSLREPSMCRKLRANRDAGTLYTILTETQATRAA